MNAAYICKHSIYKRLPLVVDPKKRYVFYIHDASVAVYPCSTTGQYPINGYNQILEALRDEGFHVISENRPAEADIYQYALKIAEDIKDLIRAWIPQENITLVATSQGATIGSVVSSLLKKEGINYVLLHAYNPEKPINQSNTKIRLTGNVLSICASQTISQSPVSSIDWDTSTTHKYEEVRLLVLENPSILHTPCKEWLEPTVNWAKRRY